MPDYTHQYNPKHKLIYLIILEKGKLDATANYLMLSTTFSVKTALQAT